MEPLKTAIVSAMRENGKAYLIVILFKAVIYTEPKTTVYFLVNIAEQNQGLFDGVIHPVLNIVCLCSQTLE